MNSQAYIYKITNKENKKIYIGSTRDRSVFLRWNEHLRSNHNLAKDFELYGITSFTFEVLEELQNISDKDLYKCEADWIQTYNSINEGYNIIMPSAKPKRNDVELTSAAQAGLESLAIKDYYGRPTKNSNNKYSFWNKFHDEQLCLVTLMMENNYLTRDSKYSKILRVVLSNRSQRFVHIELLGEDYATDNHQDVIDLLSTVRKDNRLLPYKLKSYSITEEFIELVITIDDEIKRLKVYSPLLHEDEIKFYNRIENLSEIIS